MLYLKDLAKGFYPFPQNKPGLVLVMGNAGYGLAAAECNARAVAKVFQDFRFELFKGKIHLDLTTEQIKQLCKELGAVDHTVYGGVIVYHSGLGNRNGTLVGIERRECNYGDLISCFEALNCPSLNGKPKLFLFDICERTVDEGGERVVAEQKEALPSDFVRAHATVPGSNNFVGGPNGMSWWTYYLVKANQPPLEPSQGLTQ